jgi:hypothetical protein
MPKQRAACFLRPSSLQQNLNRQRTSREFETAGIQIE